MANLQTLVRPYLLPLIKGEATALDATAQKIVATWIAMTVNVAEHFGDQIAISGRSRNYLRKNRTVPPDWKIWISHLKREDWKPYLVHNTFFISSPKNRIKRDKLGRPIPNTQTTTMTINELYIFAASSATDIFDEWRFPRTLGAGKLKQIWPLKRNILSWPGASLTGPEADSIAGSFFRFAEVVGHAINAPEFP